MVIHCVIEDVLSKDWLIRYLLERSDLTLTQADTLMIFFEYRSRGDSLSGMILARDGGEVSKGSFDRSLRQGKNNIKKSLNTLIFSYYLGFFDKELLRSLVRICDLLLGLRGLEIPESRLKEVADVIEEACNRFVG